MTIVTREQWGARPPKQTLRIPKNPRGFGLHWNGPAMGLVDDCGDGADCTHAVRQIQNYHMDKKGWYDIAYSYMVCPNCGRKYEGRKFGYRTAANGTNAANDNYHAVMILFGRGERLTDQAKVAVLELKDTHQGRYQSSTIVPHRTFTGTQCPGNEAIAWVEDGVPPPDLETELDEEGEPVMSIDVVKTNSGVWLVAHPFRMRVPDQHADYFVNLAKATTNTQYKGPYSWDDERIEKHPEKSWF